MLIFREFFNTQSDQNSHFIFKIISKYIPKRINHKFFKNFLHENNYPIAIVYLKHVFLYIKNCNF